MATMTGNLVQTLQIWLLDSEQGTLDRCREAFEDWADVFIWPNGLDAADWANPPDAIVVSADIEGGPRGEACQRLLVMADGAPVLAVAPTRSLAQALAWFRAGVADYLPLPLDENDVRERVAAALERSAALAMQNVMVEVEPVDPEPVDVSLNLRTSEAVTRDDDDILARITPDAAGAEPGAGVDTVESDADEAPVSGQLAVEDEPTAVDGLPIPTLWEELPCGVLVFDSNANLVFSNDLGLDLFGFASLAELQDALENGRGAFNAYGANRNPLPDNQWPQILATKTRTARSAVVSIEKPDRRRAWLRIDCLPHLHDGHITRLCMTLVNLTGELPSFIPAPPTSAVPRGEKNKGRKSRPRGKKKR